MPKTKGPQSKHDRIMVVKDGKQRMYTSAEAARVVAANEAKKGGSK